MAESKGRQDEDTAAEGKSGEKSAKKIEISGAQVAGGALASVTAAFLGSYLGVAGTIFGAGLTSVVISVGGALYQRSLERTKEKLESTKEKANAAAAKAALKRATQIGAPKPLRVGESGEIDFGTGREQGGGSGGGQRDAERPRIMRPVAPGEAARGGSASKDSAQSGAGRSGSAQAGTAQSGSARSGTAQPGQAKPGAPKPGTQRPAAQQPGAGRPAVQQPGSPADGTTRKIRLHGGAMQWPGGEHVAEDPNRTRRIEQAPIDGPTRVVRPVGPEAELLGRSAADSETEVAGRNSETEVVGSEHRTEVVGEGTALLDGTEVVSPPVPRRRGLRWGVIAATSAAAFAIGMAVVTGWEGITGQSLSGGEGTTVGQVFHPAPAPQQQEEEPVQQAPETSSAPATSQAPETTGHRSTEESSSAPTTGESGSAPTGGETTGEQPTQVEPTTGAPQSTEQRQPQPQVPETGSLGSGGGEVDGQ